MNVRASLLPIEPGGIDLVHLDQLDAADELFGHHFGCGVLAVNLGQMHAGDGLHVVCDAPRVVRFVLIVQLAHHVLAKLVDGAHRIDTGADHMPPLQSPGDLVHHAQIGAHLRNDVGALHLDHDFLARVQHGAMHLRGGGRRQRLFLKFLEDFFGRRFQFAL